MRSTAWIGFAAILACVIRAAGDADAAEPPPGQMTLWSYTGIPQALGTLRDALANRRGKRPAWERKPPLKKLADPQNLESPNPAIQAAAQIKTEEDLAPQKIKAIKYLAAVGCGCHPDVSRALLASLDDCTEEVRYQAALALCETAGDPCKPCAKGTCCTPETIAKLDEIAYGKDAAGCDKEPSARVRAAARNALNACRRMMPPAEKKELPVDGGESSLHENPFRLTKSAGEAAGAEGAREPDSPYDLLQTPLDPDEGRVQSGRGLHHFAGFQPAMPLPIQPIQPVQPLAPLGPTLGVPSTMRLSAELWERVEQARRVSAAPAEVAPAAEATLAATPDTGELLQKSNNVQTVEVQRRSPVSLDPNVRGFKVGQLYTQADGAFWMPARRDLDTMLSKIDPGMIQDVIVIPGPYGVRYGPGLAFIDVVREPTPRYACGFQTHFRTSASVRTNGGQVYGRETVYGGSRDWGFRFSYGHRRGSDYLAGDDLAIPSGYENRDVWAEIGYSVNPHQRIELAYQRLDQTDTEYPCQFFDVGFLGTDGFQVQVTDEDPLAPWSKLTIHGWYNRTRFTGNMDHKRNPGFPVLDRVEWALDDYYQLPHDESWPYSRSRLAATTQGAVGSGGMRAAMTFGDPDDLHMRVGADFRYLTQNLREDFRLDFAPGEGEAPTPPDPWYTNLPHAWLRDPGMYAELSLPRTENWTVNLGARVDWVRTTARASDVRQSTSLRGGHSRLEQEDVLYAFYLTNQLDLGEDWTLRAGFGHGQRPPTLVERYADGLFLGIIQSGFTRVIGRPDLDQERNWQIDVGLDANQESWRGRAGFFHAWVQDYVTLMDNTVAGLNDARLLYFANTELATLTGFELAGEFDLAPRLSAFGAMRYVDGRDRQIHAPLCAIPPLDSVVGLRLHDPAQARRWGVECAARIVNDQDRLGTIRVAGATRLQPIEEQTPGFTAWHLRGYWSWTENLTLVAGIENLFDKNYQEHLDLRLLEPAAGFPTPTRVLSPGFTPYFSVEWVF